jgi:hypothetical protein
LDILLWSLHTLPEIAGIVVTASALFLLPGLAVLELCWRDDTIPYGMLRDDLPLRLGLALGIGIALPPLVLELAYLIRLPWQEGAVVAYLLGALFVLLVSWARRRSRDQFRRAWSWHHLLWLWVIGLIVVLRLYDIRNLSVGMWGDSYHHTMIAQLLVDNQGLFSSWEPYVPLATFTYHFGFHANVAFFHWLTGLPVTKSVLYVGQIHNVAAAVLAYVLATRITGRPSVGLWAALLTGLLNSQPAYYMNWGRYTQLTGQVILPVVLVSWMEALGREKIRWPLVILSAIVTACLALTHYIVSIFAVLFLGVYLIVLLSHTPSWETLRRLGGRSVAIVAIALFLTLPWILNSLSGYLVRNAVVMNNAAVDAMCTTGSITLPSIVPFYIKQQILLCAFIGCLIALGQREWKLALLVVWTLVLILVVVPQVFGLPGAGIVDWFTGYVAFYVTLIPLAAYTFGVAQERLERLKPRLVRLAAVAAMVSLSIWGMNLDLGRVDPQHEFFTQADAEAMDWIRTNTPTTARFLVNSFPAYGGNVVAGTDGGWWIPLLTGRQTNLPPINYGIERSIQEGYGRQVNAFAAAIRGRALENMAPVRVDLTIPTARQMLRDAHIGYVYSGARQRPGPEQADRIDVAALRASESFRKIYASGGVEIFQLVDGD